MFATNASFAGEMLSDYGCMLCQFDSSGGVTTVSSGADITFTKVSSLKNNRFKIIDTKYEEVYTATMQICKIDENDKYFDGYEEGRIQRWLCRKETHKFKVDEERFYDCYFMGMFTSKKIEIGGQCAGFELTLTTDSPYAYKEFDAITATLNDANNHTLTIFDVSDEIGISYPKISIKVEETGDFDLKNSIDNHEFTLKSCQSGELVTLDCENQTITSNMRTSSELGKNGICNYSFPRIVNTYEDTKNEITTNLDCEITVSYCPVKKVGL